MTDTPRIPKSFPAGTRLAERYRVEELLGDGGMAQIYRATHETLDRPVAIKVLARTLCWQPTVVVRFLQEARASSRVRHDNVVEITDFGEAAGRPFMVMEYLEGEDLSTTLAREQRLPWGRVKPIALQVLAALQAAHGQRVIHRDIKPENVFRIHKMGSPDFIKVLDFGVAKILDGDGHSKPLTLEGQLLGTPAYMSPEQCLGDPIDARSDLYAVGILMFEMLTGRTPFEAKDAVGYLQLHVGGEVPRMADLVSGVDIPSGLEAIVQRALSKKPEDRFASAQEFAEAILTEWAPMTSTLMTGLRNHFLPDKVT